MNRQGNARDGLGLMIDNCGNGVVKPFEKSHDGSLAASAREAMSVSVCTLK